MVVYRIASFLPATGLLRNIISFVAEIADGMGNEITSERGWGWGWGWYPTRLILVYIKKRPARTRIRHHSTDDLVVKEKPCTERDEC